MKQKSDRDRADCLRKLQVYTFHNVYSFYALAEVCGTLFLSSFSVSEFAVI